MTEDRNSTQCGDTINLLGGTVALKCEFILENTYPRSNDAAFVSGSLIEGIGNINSDLDVYVITDQLLRERDIDRRRHFRVFDPARSILTGSNPDAEVFLIHTVIPGERIKIDIEYRTWTEVEALTKTVRDMFVYACESLISLTKVMNSRDLAFIHRLFNSKGLRNDMALGHLRSLIDIVRFRYLLYRWKVADYSVLLDMQGAWSDRDWIRCADMARENMVTQFHAYTHLCGNTSYNRKWIIPYARRLNVNKSLYDRYLSLLTAGAGQSEGELRAYILATIDFVDDVFDACSSVVKKEPCYPSGWVALSAIDEYLRTELGDYSENEIAYCKKPYGVHSAPTRSWFS